jgi:3-hydroxyisobutyrate dehydrogenase-like beta-hydroxyacid dehydrogenase
MNAMPAPATSLRPGVIGLGQIGGGVAQALHRSGFAPVVYDVFETAMDALALVATSAASSAEVGELADVVLVAVVDDAQVEDAISGPTGILTAANPPRVVAILSTVSLSTILASAEAGRARGVEVIDCGVTGGMGALAANSIITLVGGSEEVVELARPVIEGFSKPMMHVGPLGAGMRAKIARNAVQWTEWLVTWEAARLAEAGGIDPETFVQIIRESRAWALDDLALIAEGIGLETSLPRSEHNSDARLTHRLALGHKDLRAALELGDDLGVPLRSPAIADELLDRIFGAAG